MNAQFARPKPPASATMRCKGETLAKYPQHCVVSVETTKKPRPPWNKRVITACGQTLFPAAVKVGTFMEPPLCEHCFEQGVNK